MTSTMQKRYHAGSYEFAVIERAVKNREYQPLVQIDGQRWRVVKVELGGLGDDCWLDVELFSDYTPLYVSTPL